MNKHHKKLRDHLQRIREEKKAELLAYLDQQTGIKPESKAVLIEIVNHGIADSSKIDQVWFKKKDELEKNFCDTNPTEKDNDAYKHINTAFTDILHIQNAESLRFVDNGYKFV